MHGALHVRAPAVRKKEEKRGKKPREEGKEKEGKEAFHHTGYRKCQTLAKVLILYTEDLWNSQPRHEGAYPKPP